ncbi:hypothetical protein Ancab_037639 [Ancistrocladus abbreviatus]
MGISASGLVFFILLAVPCVYGAQTYTVDWALGKDYSSWATKNINVGDTIVFNYDSSSHQVAQVSKDDYSNCVSSNSIKTYNDGKTSIALKKSGPMYFICGTPGHCPGMQLQINVQDSSSSPTTPSTPTTTTPSSSTPSSTTPSGPSTKSTGAASGTCFNNMNGLAFGLCVVLGTLFVFMG